MRYKFLGICLLLLNYFFFQSSAQDTLLLFHPTAYNLEVLQKLLDEGILALDDYHILGVYHEGETNDYETSGEYIRTHPGTQFSLQAVASDLQPGNIFEKNLCSAQFRELFKRSRGALFMGGPDIPPVTYHEKVHLLTSVTDPYRHYFELSYLFHLLGGSQDKTWIPFLEENPKYLVSGICLGMQTMHVATGGTLVQDIPTELYNIWNADDLLEGEPDQMHRNYADKLNTGCNAPTSYHFHRIKLEKKEVLSRGIGFNSRNTPLVLSSHHQALENLSEDWVVAATSMDGKIIEAIHHSRYPHVIGVQFHPEKPGLFDPSHEHMQNCSSTINFQESIKGTNSYKFHLAYWKYLAQILRENR
ncbi:MAG: gamma-glutamyl-gamma-aminobutyrate hydrolase family protein [Bacteroidota bacterium]